MITILQLAVFRGAKENETGNFTMGSIEKTGLPFFGGCSVCGATVAAYNSCPSRSGTLKCSEGCIDNDGWETVEEANISLFPEEYKWNGMLHEHD